MPNPGRHAGTGADHTPDICPGVGQVPGPSKTLKAKKKPKLGLPGGDDGDADDDVDDSDASDDAASSGTQLISKDEEY